MVFRYCGTPVCVCGEREESLGYVMSKGSRVIPYLGCPIDEPCGDHALWVVVVMHKGCTYIHTQHTCFASDVINILPTSGTELSIGLHGTRLIKTVHSDEIFILWHTRKCVAP